MTPGLEIVKENNPPRNYLLDKANLVQLNRLNIILNYKLGSCALKARMVLCVSPHCTLFEHFKQLRSVELFNVVCETSCLKVYETLSNNLNILKPRIFA